MKRVAPGTGAPGGLGGAMEQRAADYLLGRGLRLLARNHRCRQGEIDLVMRDGDTIVFVEVRYRGSCRFGTPAESVDAHKQRRLIAAANHYLQRNPSVLPCRFDVVAISGQDEDGMEWLRDAFSADIY